MGVPCGRAFRFNSSPEAAGFPLQSLTRIAMSLCKALTTATIFNTASGGLNMVAFLLTFANAIESSMLLRN